MKNLLLLTACITLLFCCKQNPPIEETHTHKTTQWYVYNNPVNGFNVTIFARMYDTTHYNSCEITVFLKKGDSIYSVKQLADYNSFYQKTPIEDTIYVDNPTDKNDDIIFDYRTAVSFADVNFDGKDELVICGCPQANRIISTQIVHENFYVYSVGNDTLAQLHNILFDRFARENQVIEYTDDPKKNAIILTEQFNDIGTITEVFCFKKGNLFKIDYKYDYNYMCGKPVNHDSIVFHFDLPKDAERYKLVNDSIILLI